MNSWESELREAINRRNQSDVLRILKLGFPIDLPIRLRDAKGHLALGMTYLLHWVVQLQLQEVLNFLLSSRVNVNSVNSQGRTALMVAAVQEDLPTIKLLIAHNGDPLKRDLHGNTILHIAAEKGLLQIVEYCVQTLKIPVIVTNKVSVKQKKETPYMLCQILQQKSNSLPQIQKLQSVAEYLHASRVKFKENNGIKRDEAKFYHFERKPYRSKRRVYNLEDMANIAIKPQNSRFPSKSTEKYMSTKRSYFQRISSKSNISVNSASYRSTPVSFPPLKRL